MAVDFQAVTFNLFHDYPQCRHIDRRLALLEAELARTAPEVVFLQEASVSLLYGHLAERLVDGLRQHDLRYDLHYAPANGSIARGEVFEEGSAILSRWPITDAAVRELAAGRRIEREYQGYRFVERRIAIAATLRIEDGVEIEAVGAHVTDAPAEGEVRPRQWQIEDLERFVAERGVKRERVIVGGDFNARPEAEEIAWLRERGFVDVCEASDPGATNDPDDRDLESPNDSSRHRIDYLFVGPGRRSWGVRATRLFLARPAEVEPGRYLWASDHNGISADLFLDSSAA